MSEQEILPPDDEADKKLQGEGRTIHQRLVTTGQIKSELGKIYRKVASNKLDENTARTCTGILRVMLKATEQEHMFQLAADDPDDDTPSLTGVMVIGPGTTKKQIEDMRKLMKPSTRKEKSNDKP